jgi:hypothetical protein
MSYSTPAYGAYVTKWHADKTAKVGVNVAPPTVPSTTNHQLKYSLPTSTLAIPFNDKKSLETFRPKETSLVKPVPKPTPRLPSVILSPPVVSSVKGYAVHRPNVKPKAYVLPPLVIPVARDAPSVVPPRSVPVVKIAPPQSLEVKKK